ncbi:MAG: hypothetical protein BGO78_08725 [Chloroflexi bacterium 44-23]|nr:MAG: hypothetical protein BGO78_08725 [Chloroflexi bacterium 44-23]
MKENLELLIQEVQRNSKYRHIDRQLIENVAILETAKGRSFKDSVKAVRNKLHQIANAYQPTSISYTKIIEKMISLPTDLKHPSVRTFCQETMRLHTSTRERLPELETFFLTSLGSMAPITSLLDVACGLNPLALAWMPTTPDVRVYACDVFGDQIDFLNRFFTYFGINGQAFSCDLTQTIPEIEVDVTFILKTIPCLEQIDKNIAPRLLANIKSKNLLVSFPTRSLAGQGKGMRQNYNQHFQEIVNGHNWRISQFSFSNEEAYLIQK